jgi:hypothetical protein
MTATLTPPPAAGEWRPEGVDLDDLFASSAGLSGRELGERLVEIDRLRRALEAAAVGVLDEAERSDAYRDDGHLTLRSWARGQVVWSRQEARQRLDELDLIRLCPQVAAALETGRLGVAYAAEMARARSNPRCGDRIADCIDEFLDWAGKLDFEGFRTVVRRWEQLADTDGAHRDHEQAHMARRASISNVDAEFHLRAQFGVIQGTAMAKILDAFTDAEYQADLDAVKAEFGDQATPALITRTAAQRRADALHAIFIAAVTGNGQTLAEPIINLVCDVRTFEEHVARAVGATVTNHDDLDDLVGTGTDTDPGDDVDHDGDADLIGDLGGVAMGEGLGLRRCETLDGAPVDPSDMIAAALIGHIRRVIVDRQGVVVDAGRKTRCFRGISRDMVWLLGTSCCWWGCDCRLGVQVDHLDEYVRDGGTTDQHNAGSLHGAHNRFKTANGYRITRDDAGFLHIWRPDGTEMRPR